VKIQPLLLRPGEVATRLGVGVDRIRRMVRDGELPVVKLGPRITRIPREAVDALMHPSTVKDYFLLPPRFYTVFLPRECEYCGVFRTKTAALEKAWELREQGGHAEGGMEPTAMSVSFRTEILEEER